MNLSTILSIDAVLPQLAARDKKQALKLMAAKAAELSELSEREIFSTLIEREHMGCTGMGSGVCIPHGRFDDLTTLHCVFATLPKPVEFGAADGKPVDILFLLLSPAGSNTDHLKALASISRRLRDKELCAKLRTSTDAATIYTLLTSPLPDDA